MRVATYIQITVIYIVCPYHANNAELAYCVYTAGKITFALATNYKQSLAKDYGLKLYPRNFDAPTLFHVYSMV